MELKRFLIAGRLQTPGTSPRSSLEKIKTNISLSEERQVPIYERQIPIKKSQERQVLTQT